MSLLNISTDELNWFLSSRETIAAMRTPLLFIIMNLHWLNLSTTLYRLSVIDSYYLF
jgi:hypothetical protein